MAWEISVVSEGKARQTESMRATLMLLKHGGPPFRTLDPFLLPLKTGVRGRRFFAAQE